MLVYSHVHGEQDSLHSLTVHCSNGTETFLISGLFECDLGCDSVLCSAAFISAVEKTVLLANRTQKITAHYTV